VNKDKQNEKKIYPTKSFQITRTNQWFCELFII
jgi:hypothetical protein